MVRGSYGPHPPQLESLPVPTSLSENPDDPGEVGSNGGVVGRSERTKSGGKSGVSSPVGKIFVIVVVVATDVCPVRGTAQEVCAEEILEILTLVVESTRLLLYLRLSN